MIRTLQTKQYKNQEKMREFFHNKCIVEHRI